MFEAQRCRTPRKRSPKEMEVRRASEELLSCGPRILERIYPSSFRSGSVSPVGNRKSIRLGIHIYIDILCYTMPVMALSIKSIEVERMAREISSKTGESLTGAIQRALEERLERLKQARRQQILKGQLEEILQRVDRLPILDSRSPDEILGYDEHGLPR